MKVRFLATAALALGAAIALPAAASAYTSYTTGSVNLRTGPGVGYTRIGSLPPGAAVDVSYCQYSWCAVSTFLGNGWVSSSYLGGARAYPQPYPPLFVQPYRPPFYIQPYPRVYPRFYRQPTPFFNLYIGPRRRW